MDKFSRCWRFLYGLASRTPANIIIAETGVTGKTIQEVVARLGSKKAATLNNKLGRYLAEVQEAGTACYLWPLETHFGDLDDAGAIKERWVLSGQSAGIVFPQRSYPVVFYDPLPTAWRTWPDFEAIAAAGLRIR